MEAKDILTMSENGKSEYCCSVVRISELTPVEDSDFLAKTNVLGTQIVVRKDQVHTGDVMFYAANETALNERFLSLNNMFEIGLRDMNANAAEVNAIMKEYDDKYKNKADELRAQAKQLKGSIDGMTKTVTKAKKSLKKIDEKYDSYSDAEKVNADVDRKNLTEKIDKLTADTLEKTVTYTNLKKEIDQLVADGKHIVDEAKKHVGFFNKYGRVRCITLKGCPSFGFLFGVEEMSKFCPEIKEMNLCDYINHDFDTVNGELFVKAYVPPVKPENIRKTRGEKRNKKLSRFDRLVEGEFFLHYDSTKLAKNFHLMTPDRNVLISNKLHGTSCVFGKVHVKNPLPMFWPKKMWNKFIDLLNGSEKLKFKFNYTIDYGPVFSSRSIIKNRYINNEVNSGYYGVDIWTEYGEIDYPYLDDGMTIYGEICGYLTGSQTYIQKLYDYGNNPGENFLMVYRISTTDEDGKKKEWNVQDVYDWTVKLIDRMKENNDDNWKRIHPIDIFYHGTLGDLYPDVDESEHWHENVLERMKADKEHFGMEEYEPMCKNKVPREGICLRLDDDPILENFKLKTTAFELGEALLYDDDDYQDIEVQQGDYEPVTEQNEGEN